MRVKIGDQWFEPTPSQAICIELTSSDKANINAMSEERSRYGAFHDDDHRSDIEMLEWMREGSKT
ncbi:hypothetical protein EPK99_06490 [Neorhizobium lilium]|uniref:Uncharacterized protein n=1 Tax=Neorhizobium lilium TaxID=2503024 RepID=A0A3S3RK56_9HYPH|nr:hypothetical protein [Neorhizobium lilium]RWX78277.1 hypothetical protein EPK99_06490 [Neorhizobium lilium]